MRTAKVELRTLERRREAGQAAPADVALAKVESRATRQLARAARQDYVTALTDLRNQIGIPEAAAETEPLGEFTLPGNIPPIDEQAFIQAALACRPDLHASQAAIEGAGAAVKLAKGDRIPTTIIGPQYVQDEAGIQYVGLNFVPTLPILDNGKPLVRQREAEQRRAVVAYEQARQRAVTQVRSTVAKWNGATGLVGDSSGLTQELAGEVASLERLFEAGQTDLTRVQQARQRLIQLENARLDALWNATQAQADLMLAVGVPNMIQGLLQAAEADAGVVAPRPAPNPPTPTTGPSPFSASTPTPR
jgi:outer membrane protein, heavy metal efflux system